MKNKRSVKEEQGITLMALIITIIVLAILAAITVSAAYTSGIIQMGTQGAKDYAVATVKENEILNETTAYIDNVVKNIKRKLGNWEYFEETQTVNGKEGNSNNPTIPAGFRPINTNEAKWGTGEENPSKESVDNGLVIEDKDGNQFVWVPCYVEDIQKIEGTSYPKYEKYTYTGGNASDIGTNQADNNGWRTYSYRAYNDWTYEEAKKYGEASVKKYGGFWIGRYEAGIPENASFYPKEDDAEYKTSERNVTEESGVELKPISKAGYFSWNFIEQTNAKTVSENMYKGSEDIESHLVDGIAWDTVMKWFETNEESKGYVTNSLNKGNYTNTIGTYTGKYAEHIYCTASVEGSGNGWAFATKYQNGSTNYGSLDKTKQEVENGLFTKNATLVDDKHTFSRRIETPTGANDNFAVKNIYDMAGNMFEWTTETSTHNASNEGTFAALRGGEFNYNSTYHPAGIRVGSSDASGPSVWIGFRVVIYIK